MTDEDDIAVQHGSGNIFADLGFADPETHLLKARLMSQIVAIVRDLKPTQTETARRVGVSQPDISRMLKGQFRDISVERIMRMLARLGCEIDIVVRPSGGMPAAIRIPAAA